MLLRYVAGYVPKFSDSFAQEWLNDQASDYAVARRILSECHPLEPEMSCSSRATCTLSASPAAPWRASRRRCPGRPRSRRACRPTWTASGAART
eukprot:10447181-Alexandrium_andersonii.AAC.1